jgi:hypothetical protein
MVALTQELLSGVFLHVKWCGRFRIGVELGKNRRIVAKVLLQDVNPGAIGRMI